MTTAAVVRTVWRQQAVWSATATALKRGLTRSRSWLLGLTVTAAIIEVLAASLLGGSGAAVSAGRALAACGAAMLAVAALIRSQGLGRDRMAAWIRARSASEGLKAAVYLYLMRAGEFGGPDPSGKLRGAADQIVGQVSDLEPFAARVRPPEREPPLVQDLTAYVTERVEKQIEGYYRPKAAEFASRLAVFRQVELALLIVAAILGGFASLFAGSWVAPWIAVLTTVTGALATHVAASRYEHQVITYRGTARRLEALRDEWHDRWSSGLPPGEQASTFVKNVEDAISTENEAWMAAWIKNP